MTQVVSPPEHRVFLEDISWETYQAILRDLGESRGSRLAYDQGVLEIMSPSREHEKLKRLIGRFIETLTLESGLEIDSTSATTLQRVDLQKGVEADECYYIRNAAAVRGKRELDLLVDPPPDLVVEVDISRTSRVKLPIYAALGIREVWHHNGDELAVLQLQEDGKYLTTNQSEVFPNIPVKKLSQFLERRHSAGENELLRSFQDWVRERPGK